jgi:tetratricopeptide (TPR) repeat protein
VAELARGAIADRPWGRTLFALGAKGLTGQLTLAAEGRRYCIAFHGGAVIGATSPLALDAASRVALQAGLISSTQVSEIARRQAAAPDRDEIEVVLETARLPAEHGPRLRRRVIAQRAARTFAIERGDFVVHDQIAIPYEPAGLDVRTIIYLGARSQMTDVRLAAELADIGEWFSLSSDAAAFLPQFGFAADDQAIIELLGVGATLAELEGAIHVLDPRTVRAIVYALVSCGLCTTDPSTRAPAPAPPPPPPMRAPAQPAARAQRPSRAPAIAAPTPRPPTPIAPAPPPPELDALDLEAPDEMELAPEPAPAPAPTPPPARGLPVAAPAKGLQAMQRSPSSAAPRGTPEPVAPPPRAVAPHPQLQAPSRVIRNNAPAPAVAVAPNQGPRALAAQAPPRPGGRSFDGPTLGMDQPTQRDPHSPGPLAAPYPLLDGDDVLDFDAPAAAPAPPASGRKRPGPSRSSLDAPAGPARAKPLARAPIKPEQVAEIRALIDARAKLLAGGADHFELLGVGRNANEPEIRKAYFALARQLHPDRLAAVGIKDAVEAAHRVFAQVNTAFAILGDAKRRAEYLQIVARGGEAAVRRENQQAEELALRVFDAEGAFKRGEQLLRTDQIPAALRELTRAIELNPDEPDYHAALAWAKFCANPDKATAGPATRKVLEGVIRKSPNPVSARLYLGRMERMLGRDQEALRQFRAVLEEEPNHPHATAEIRVIESRLGGARSKR